MKLETPKLSVVDMAYEVLHMHRTILDQEAELEELRRYRQDYFDLLDSSIKHGEHMMGGLLRVAMQKAGA